MNLQGKVAIITGAASGIGKSIATRFARDGATVVIDYEGSSKDADDLVAALKTTGSHAIAISADISDEEQVRMLMEETVKQLGGLDILVNNAGIEKKFPFLETPKEAWDKIIAVNLTGPFLCCKYGGLAMVKAGKGGRIINISSIHEDVTMPTNAPYCASKGGVRMLMRTIAVELAPHGITVNNIGPGAVFTPIDADIEKDPEKMKTLLAEIPLGRMGKPDEIAHLAAFLASDDAAYITGSTYFIDGGMSRQSGSM